MPGKKTVLTFSGSGLESTSNFWSSVGGTARRVTELQTPIRSVFEVTCPENARELQALQIAGPDGASNYQLVLIDALRTQPHQNNHQSRTNAHRITPPAAVDCILKSEKIDYYVFSAKTGERFSVEAIAHRMGSEMDPVVHVLDADGRELMVCDDEPGVWRDSRFVFTCAIGRRLPALRCMTPVTVAAQVMIIGYGSRMNHWFGTRTRWLIRRKRAARSSEWGQR
jgi:hypothetical protein